MDLNVLYFAHVRERTGVARETLQLDPGATVAEAVRAIIDRHPEVERLLPSVRFALNGEFVDGSAVVPFTRMP